MIDSISVSVIYNLSKKIEPYVRRVKNIPKQYMKFTKFQFMMNNFEQEKSKVKLDPKEYMVVIISENDPNKILGKLLISDISSIILDDMPRLKIKEKWLRINGRKITTNEDYSISNNNN